MNAQRVIYRILCLTLIFCLGIPQSALALRAPNAKDSPPLEQALTAGMEEPQRYSKALRDIFKKARHELHLLASYTLWMSDVEVLERLMAALLDHPAPLAVKPKVTQILKDLDILVLEPARRSQKEYQNSDFISWAVLFPQADHWLANATFNSVHDGQFIQRNKALAIYSSDGAALAWGRTGPHLRANFIDSDRVDINVGPSLLAGFVPQLEQMLDRPELEPKAREYAALLFNGLIIPAQEHSVNSFQDYVRYFEQWVNQYRLLGSGDLERMIGLAAKRFPDLLPEDPFKTPDAFFFSNAKFAVSEALQVEKFNAERVREPNQRISLWDLTTGAQKAQPYLEGFRRSGRYRWRQQEFLESVVSYLLARGRAATAAGAEEGDSRFRPLSPPEFLKRTRQPVESLKAYYRRRFGRWNNRTVQGGNKQDLFLVLWKEPDPHRAPEQSWMRHQPFLETVIYETVVALGVNAAEVLIPTWAERTSLARRYASQEWIKPEDISLRRLVSSYTSEEAVVFQQDPKKAFTRALVVLGLLARVWDLHRWNMEFIPGTKVLLYFDFEEALNFYYDDMKLYTSAFLLNYFHPKIHSGPVRLSHLLERIDWKEWRAAVRDVGKMNFDVLREQVKHNIANSYDGHLPDRLSDQIDGYFERLIAHQGSIRSDAKAFWKHAVALQNREEGPDAANIPGLSSVVTAREKPEQDTRMARLIAAVEAVVQADPEPDTLPLGKQVVIVDAALLHLPDVVRLIRVLEGSQLFKGRTIIWGKDDLPKPHEVALPDGLHDAGDQEQLERLLGEMAQNGLTTATFIGPPHEGFDVLDTIARMEPEITFYRPNEPSLSVFLAGLGISQDLLEQLSTDPELNAVLSVQL